MAVVRTEIVVGIEVGMRVVLFRFGKYMASPLNHRVRNNRGFEPRVEKPGLEGAGG